MTNSSDSMDKLIEALKNNFSPEELIEIYAYLQPRLERNGYRILAKKIEEFLTEILNNQQNSE